MDENSLAFTVWTDEAIATIIIKPTLDNSRSLVQFFQIILASVCWLRAGALYTHISPLYADVNIGANYIATKGLDIVETEEFKDENIVVI